LAPPLLVQALRLPFLTGSLLPVVMVAAWVWKQGPLSWGHLGLTLLGVAGLHLGANLLNDYFDAKGSDPGAVYAGQRGEHPWRLSERLHC